MSSTETNQIAQYVTAITSTTLRLGAYVFLRWIPGHVFPPVLLALFAAYVPAFIYNLTHTPSYRVISDEIDIVTRDTIDPDDAEDDIDPRYADSDDRRNEPLKEIDVEETIVVEERDQEVLKTLTSGLPSPTSLLWSAVTFAINSALILMVLDLVYRGPLLHPSHDLSMARVGYVSENSARVLVREPSAAHYPIYASWRYADSPNVRGGYGDPIPQDTAWKSAGSIDWLDNSTDFTGTITLNGLKSDTRYQYVVSNNHTGFFVTAPRIGHTSDRPEARGTFTFLHSSCLKNNFPYLPFRHSLSNQGLQYLAQSIQGLGAQFMLFLGDFIYIDVPRRLGATAEDYRKEYRQVYASPDWAPATKNLPWIHVMDDHEIKNDASRGEDPELFAAALDPYDHYHTSVNPPTVRSGEGYFQFTQGPATFFMLDTRRYRSPNDQTNGSDTVTGDPSKTMLGQQQLSDLLTWLKRTEPAGVRWKVVVSSVPFTKNWKVGSQDTWRGYLGERQLILEAMWDVGLSGGVGVIILSGDRHEFAATAFPPPSDGKEVITGLGPIGVGASGFGLLSPDSVAGRGLQTKRKRWPLSATVHEFSSSPLSMFYLPVRTYAESSTSPDYVSDVCIKYIPDGNSKFGAVSISNPATSDQSVLHYRLFVDGEEAWSYTITTPPDVRGSRRSKDATWG